MAATTMATIQILAAEDGIRVTKRGSVSAHTMKVRSLAFSPDGRLLASSGDDRMVKLWQVDNGTLKSPSEPIPGHTSVTFAPSGKILFIGRGSGRTSLDFFDLASRKTVRAIDTGHAVESVTVSPDSQRVATSAFLDNNLKVWDATSGKLVVSFSTPRRPGPGADESIVRPMGYTAFSPDGKYFVGCAASSDFMCIPTILDAKTSEVRCRFLAHNNRAFSLRFSPDAKTLAIGTQGGSLKLWDVSTLVKAWATRNEGNEGEADPQRIAALIKQLDGDQFRIRDAAHRELLKIGGAVESSLQIALKSSRSAEFQKRASQILAAISQPLETLTAKSVLATRQTGGVRSLSFSPDGRLLAAGSWLVNTTKGQLTVWNLLKPDSLVLDIQTVGIEALSFSPDGRMLVTGMQDGTIIVWDVATVEAN